MRIGAFTVLMAILMLPVCIRADGERVAQKLKSNAVSVTAERSEGTHVGFGFIFGERNDTVYVVTANHVVRGDTPNDISTEITVRFSSNPGTACKATLMENKDKFLDVAVLLAIVPGDSEWREKSLGSLKKVKRGEEVWFIGRFGDWYVPAEPGVVDDIDSINHRIEVSNLTVSPGTSGSPLLVDDGIVGMVVSRETVGEVQAVPVTLIQTLVQSWGYPWQLKGYKSWFSLKLAAIGGVAVGAVALLVSVLGNDSDESTGPDIPDFPPHP